MTHSDLWQGARRHLPSAPASSAVLLLHGLGSNADDLIELAPLLAPALPETAFLSPNAPFPCDMAPFGRQWFSLQNWTPANLWQGVCAAAPALEQMIADVRSEFALPMARLALLGFSQGCMMSLHVAPRLPEALGAVVGLSGALVGPEHVAAETRSRPPVLLAHGQIDPVVPYGALPLAQATLEAAGFAVETVTRPLMAHNIDDEVLAATADFLRRHLS